MKRVKYFFIAIAFVFVVAFESKLNAAQSCPTNSVQFWFNCITAQQHIHTIAAEIVEQFQCPCEPMKFTEYVKMFMRFIEKQKDNLKSHIGNVIVSVPYEFSGFYDYQLKKAITALNMRFVEKYQHNNANNIEDIDLTREQMIEYKNLIKNFYAVTQVQILVAVIRQAGGLCPRCFQVLRTELENKDLSSFVNENIKLDDQYDNITMVLLAMHNLNLEDTKPTSYCMPDCCVLL